MNPFAREAGKHGRSRSNAERATTKPWISKHLDGCIPDITIISTLLYLLFCYVGSCFHGCLRKEVEADNYALQ